jgi:hypothetical protein
MRTGIGAYICTEGKYENVIVIAFRIAGNLPLLPFSLQPALSHTIAILGLQSFPRECENKEMAAILVP